MSKEQKNRDPLEELFTHLGDIEIPLDLDDRIMASVRESVTKKEKYAEIKQILGVAASAAAIVILAVCAIFCNALFQRNAGDLLTSSLMMQGAEEAMHHSLPADHATPYIPSAELAGHALNDRTEQTHAYSLDIRSAFEGVADIFSEAWLKYLSFVVVVLMLLLADHAIRSRSLRKHDPEYRE